MLCKVVQQNISLEIGRNDGIIQFIYTQPFPTASADKRSYKCLHGGAALKFSTSAMASENPLGGPTITGPDGHKLHLPAPENPVAATYRKFVIDNGVLKGRYLFDVRKFFFF